MATPIFQQIITLAAQLTPEERARLIQELQQAEDETEEELEQRLLTEALGDALRSDGSIDYSRMEVLNISFEELEAEDE
jgi:acyl-CoA reductase-like NAD-dependent aldehyde dehydrogenase